MSAPEMFCDAQILRRISKLLRHPERKLFTLRAPTSGLSLTNIGALGSFSTMSLQPMFTTRACPEFFIGPRPKADSGDGVLGDGAASFLLTS